MPVLMDRVLFSENSSAALGAKGAHLAHRSEQCGILIGTPGWSLADHTSPGSHCEKRGGTMVSLRPAQPGQPRGLQEPTHLFSCQVVGREQSSDVADVHFKQRCFSTLQEGK